MHLLCKGGDWKDANNFDPAQVPTSADRVILDQTTEDVIVDINATCGELQMTNFKKDIYYGIIGGSIRQCGIIRNEDRYDLFLARPDIVRVD
jgi:hypothetical protein